MTLKHDIESTVFKAYKLAEIEQKYGHRGTYYAHACLLDDPNNVKLLKKMQSMGHEISYHYDVMDSNHGNLDNAIVEFEYNRKRFEELGLQLGNHHGKKVIYGLLHYLGVEQSIRMEKILYFCLILEKKDSIYM